MDDAERWLSSNDPEYVSASADWRHLTSGEYRGPRDEVPRGLRADLVELAARTGGLLVEHGASGDKLCAVCHTPFAPRKSDHQFCGDICRAQARRVWIRDYRRAKRAA